MLSQLESMERSKEASAAMVRACFDAGWPRLDGDLRGLCTKQTEASRAALLQASKGLSQSGGVGLLFAKCSCCNCVYSLDALRDANSFYGSPQPRHTKCYLQAMGRLQNSYFDIRNDPVHCKAQIDPKVDVLQHSGTDRIIGAPAEGSLPGHTAPGDASLVMYLQPLSPALSQESPESVVMYGLLSCNDTFVKHACNAGAAPESSSASGSSGSGDSASIVWHRDWVCPACIHGQGQQVEGKSFWLRSTAYGMRWLRATASWFEERSKTHRVWVEVPADAVGSASHEDRSHASASSASGGNGVSDTATSVGKPDRPVGMLAVAAELGWSGFWDVLDLSMVDAVWDSNSIA